MSIRPTFFGLYTARSGIVASQANIDVTGQNLSNILTPGYTRQRADLLSIGDSGYKNRISDPNGIHIGQGVDVHSISQLRDAGYDVRYRQENTKYGYEETRLSGLEDIGRALDEYFLEGGLSTALSDLYKTFEAAMDDASSSTNSQVIQNQMAILNDIFHQTSKSLESVKEQQEGDFKITVNKINTVLNKISVLNQQIKEDALFNNPAHELKDQRNLLLDELSGYLNIEYKYDPDNLDELSVNYVGPNKEKIPLVQGNKVSQLELHLDEHKESENAGASTLENPHIIVKFADKMKLPDNIQPPDATSIALEASDVTTGAVGAYFDLLTGVGNYGAEVDNRGVAYYQKMLDTFVNTYAQRMNDINRGKVELGKDGSFSESLSINQMLNIKDADGNKINWQIVQTDANGNPVDNDGNILGPNDPRVYRALERSDLEGKSAEDIRKIFADQTNQDLAAAAEGVYIYGTDRNLLVSSKGDKITASNIAISENWKADLSLLNASIVDRSDMPIRTKPLTDEEKEKEINNADNDNFQRFISDLFQSKKITFTEGDKTIFTGGMYEFLTGMQNTQGLDESSALTNAKALGSSVNNLEDNRMSVSGVDENEETANMLMFQKAFTASSRILTAMDELLETLINKTGVVGR